MLLKCQYVSVTNFWKILRFTMKIPNGLNGNFHCGSIRSTRDVLIRYKTLFSSSDLHANTLTYLSELAEAWRRILGTVRLANWTDCPAKKMSVRTLFSLNAQSRRAGDFDNFSQRAFPFLFARETWISHGGILIFHRSLFDVVKSLHASYDPLRIREKLDKIYLNHGCPTSSGPHWSTKICRT